MYTLLFSSRRSPANSALRLVLGLGLCALVPRDLAFIVAALAPLPLPDAPLAGLLAAFCAAVGILLPAFMARTVVRGLAPLGVCALLFRIARNCLERQ